MWLESTDAPRAGLPVAMTLYRLVSYCSYFELIKVLNTYSISSLQKNYNTFLEQFSYRLIVVRLRVLV